MRAVRWIVADLQHYIYARFIVFVKEGGYTIIGVACAIAIITIPATVQASAPPDVTAPPLCILGYEWVVDACVPSEPATTSVPVTIGSIDTPVSVGIPPLIIGDVCLINDSTDSIPKGEWVLDGYQAAIGTHSISAMPCGYPVVDIGTPPVSLPATGSSSRALAVVAALSLLAGLGALFAARRRPTVG